MQVELNSEIIGCLKVIAEILDDAIFLFHKDGLKIYELTKDDSNAVMFDYKFKCKLEDKFTVDMSKLIKIIKIPKPDDKVILSIEKDDNMIKIEVKSEGFEREFFIRKMVVDSERVMFNPDDKKNRQLEFPVKFVVLKQVFEKVLQEATMFNSFCFISTDGKHEKATLFAEDESGKGYKSEFTIGCLLNAEARAKYDMDFMKVILKANTNSLEVSFGDNYPMKFFFNGDDYDFTFIVAPLIDD